MKATIAGHITLDVIVAKGERRLSLGGPPLYMGLLLRRLGVEVTLLTKFGPDLGDERVTWILRSGLKFHGNPVSKEPTTMFLIEVLREGRRLTLLNRCEDVSQKFPKTDILLINPVAGEIDPALDVKAEFVYLDPQGFLRKFENGEVRIQHNEHLLENISNFNAMKTDLEELCSLTNIDEPVKAVKELHRRGVDEIIVTLGEKGTLLSLKGECYFMPAKKVEIFDGIGMGDLLGAGYAYGRFLKGPVYGLALGSLAASLYADRPGLEKIPSRDELLSAMKREMRNIVKVDLESLSE